MTGHEALAAVALQRELEAKVAAYEADPRTSPYMLKAARTMAEYVADRNKRHGLTQ